MAPPESQRRAYRRSPVACAAGDCGRRRASTFRDYGLGWDDYTHAEYGDLLLSLYASGFADRRALSFVNLYEYGGGFDLAAALLAKVLPFSVFETRRLTGAIVGLLGLLIVWRTGRRVGGPLAGFIALALLATCPLFVGHAFMNAKDAPFAVAMAFLLLGLVRAFEEYPRPGAATVVLVGVGAGLAIGTRILGGFGALYALGALALIVDRSRRAAMACARGGRVVPDASCCGCLPGLLLGYAAMALVWPWGAAEPLNPFRALQYFSRFFEEPWDELFGGALIKVTQMPRSYLPTLLALKLPEMFTALALGGVDRRADRRVPPRQRSQPARGAVARRARRRAADRDRRGDAAGDVQRRAAFPVRGAAARGRRRSRRRLAVRRAAPPRASGGDGRGRGLRRRPRAAGRRYGARAPLRIHLVQPARRRRRAARASATCSTIGACR